MVGEGVINTSVPMVALTSKKLVFVLHTVCCLKSPAANFAAALGPFLTFATCDTVDICNLALVVIRAEEPILVSAMVVWGVI